MRSTQNRYIRVSAFLAYAHNPTAIGEAFATVEKRFREKNVFVSIRGVHLPLRIDTPKGPREPLWAGLRPRAPNHKGAFKRGTPPLAIAQRDGVDLEPCRPGGAPGGPLGGPPGGGPGDPQGGIRPPLTVDP